MLDQTRKKNPLTFLSLISILPAFLFARMERNGTERGDERFTESLMSENDNNGDDDGMVML